MKRSSLAIPINLICCIACISCAGSHKLYPDLRWSGVKPGDLLVFTTPHRSNWEGFECKSDPNEKRIYPTGSKFEITGATKYGNFGATVDVINLKRDHISYTLQTAGGWSPYVFSEQNCKEMGYNILKKNKTEYLPMTLKH